MDGIQIQDPCDGNAGNLLEDLLGVPENALPVADYGILRLKRTNVAQVRKSKSSHFNHTRVLFPGPIS